MSVSERAGAHLRGHVVGYLALFVALTGTSYAANKIKGNRIAKNAITSKHIKDGEVSTSDVADNGLTGANIDESTLNVLLGDGSVTTAKLADAAVTIPKLAFDPATQAELDAVATGAVPAGNSLGAAEPPATDDQIADGTVDTQDLTDGSIANSDIATTATIDDAKLGTINDPGKVADAALSANVALLGGTQTFTGGKTFTTDVDLDLVDAENLTLGQTKTGAFTGGPLSINLINNTTSAGQQGAAIGNSSLSTGLTEELLSLNNFDTDQAVDAGLRIQSAAGGITTGLDVADADIGTALDIGANDIETSGATISSTELEKLDGTSTRTVNLPLATFFNVTDGATLDFTASNGTSPDFVNISGHPALEWDDDSDAGGVDIADTDNVATQLVVPQDYESSGTFRMTLREFSAAGALEQLVCDAANGDSAFGATDTVNLNGVPAIVTGSVDPVVTLTPGSVVVLRCHADDTLGGTTANDPVRLLFASFRYTAAY